MSLNDDDNDTKAGYCKPPTHSRFQKGKSGNPNGRPKKPRSTAKTEFLRELDRALREKITIRENGRTREITKLRAIAKQITNKAALGDPSSLRLVLPDIKWRDEAIQKELRERERPVEELTDEELTYLVRGELPPSLDKKKK